MIPDLQVSTERTTVNVRAASRDAIRAFEASMFVDREAWFDEFRDASAVSDNWADMTPEDRTTGLEDYRRIKWEPEELDLLAELRNLVAHADAGTLLMPSQAADSIHTVAKFLNGLWPPRGEPA